MNILFMTELIYPHGGGAELATHLYAQQLAANGVNVVIVTNRFPSEPAQSREGRVTSYRLPLFSGMSSVKYSTLKRVDSMFLGLIRKLMCWADVVYVPRFWYLAIVAAKMSHKPVIAHLHDYIPVCPLATLYKNTKDTVCIGRTGTLCSPKCVYSFEIGGRGNLRRSLSSVLLNMTIGGIFGKLLKFSDAIICVSEAQKELVASRAPYLKPKLHVVYNPLPDIGLTRIVCDDFGYFGGLSVNKGFHVLRKALSRISNTDLRVHVTNSPILQQSEASLLDKRLTLYGKLDSIHFEQIWQRTRAVLVPSIWQEPLPYVVSEGLLRGRIVIASSVGGIPEQVKDCKGVVLCDPASHEQLADAIVATNNLSREEVTEQGLDNRKRFLSRFSNLTSVSKFINMCESVKQQ